MEVGDDRRPPLRVQVVSDGRAGIENQALGLAEAVARLTSAEITIKRVAWRRAFSRLPTALQAPWMRDPASDDPFPAPGEPWPDLWIATGRASLPFSLAAKRRSGGRTFVIQTQDPRLSPDRFDLVVAPAHDGLDGDNVFEIVGATHRITPEALAEGAAPFSGRLEPLPRPRVAVLIGGRSSAFDLTPDHAADMAARIAAAVRAHGGSLMLTFSRRTPEAARQAMTARLAQLSGWIWDGEGANPLFGFLHAADHVLVTEDSANMATEAASTGKPVHILPMVPRGSAGKFQRLHDELQALGATRPFDGALNGWTYSPLNETERAAHAVLQAMAAR
ncbi:mitochondrial fission ELM1 family protein [Brevundimonas sp. VNH65]|uniref:mitochondrial fission ELM1 family protein n=1 Tax=Brevundimonas sp. VNH65 TaxID=3400917 RepID=UPI003C00651D